MLKRKSLTPQPRGVRSGNSDIIMSIKPEHINNIAAGTKNYEYRGYLLPSSIRCIWFYTTAPMSRIEYVARISSGKIQGEVLEDGGIGNVNFNAGDKVSKYAYEILDLWKLKQPINIKLAKSKGFLKAPPRKYCWAPLSLLESYPLDWQDHIVSKVLEYHPMKRRKQLDLKETKKGSSLSGRRKICDFFTYSDTKR